LKAVLFNCDLYRLILSLTPFSTAIINAAILLFNIWDRLPIGRLLRIRETLHPLSLYITSQTIPLASTAVAQSAVARSRRSRRWMSV